MGGEVRRKRAALAACALAACALAACGQGAASTGSNPACDQYLDAESCNACYQKQYPAGVDDYNAVATCIFCDACYTTCDSATNASFCAGPPASAGPCDHGTPDTASCDACQACAGAGSGSCAAAVDACLVDADCKALLGATCP